MGCHPFSGAKLLLVCFGFLDLKAGASPIQTLDSSSIGYFRFGGFFRPNYWFEVKTSTEPEMDLELRFFVSSSST